MSRENDQEIWIVCPECNTKLKKEHIATHMMHVHNKKIEDIDESSIKVLSKKEKKQKKPMHFSLTSIVIIAVISMAIIGAVIFVLSSSPNNGNSNDPQWLDAYTPVYSLGTETNNFWINFPSSSPKAGENVQHLSWIIEDLKEKPVIFVCHRTGCGPCTPQADRVKALMNRYGEDVIFYDLDNPFEGYGTATQDILQKFQEAFYYDPNGPPSYIAFTGVYTFIPDGGAVKIAWHAWEGNVEDAEMETWIKDIIYYYHMNSEK